VDHAPVIQRTLVLSNPCASADEGAPLNRTVWARMVSGGKLLEEKLGRNDL
jgi:hypothetical protein